MTTGIIDTNIKGSVVAKISLTTEKTITLYVFSRTGSDNNYRVGIEASPDDGTTWVDMPQTLRGQGCISFDCIATDVQAKVTEAEGDASSATVYLLAR